MGGAVSEHGLRFELEDPVAKLPLPVVHLGRNLVAFGVVEVAHVKLPCVVELLAVEVSLGVILELLLQDLQGVFVDVLGEHNEGGARVDD